MPNGAPALPRLADAESARARAKVFLWLAVLAFMLRLLVAPWMAHMGDMGAFIGWGKRLAADGPAKFWSGDYWCDYLPGYLLILQVLGEIAAKIPGEIVLYQWPLAGKHVTTITLHAHILLFKLPNLVADIVTAWIIWRLTREKTGRRHLWLPAAYLFNPAVLFNSTAWGQADSFHALGLVAGLYLLTRRHVIPAAIVLGYALAIKPHSLVLLPIALVFAVRQRLPWPRIVSAVVMAPAVFAATFLPFNDWKVLTLGEFIRHRFSATMGEYGYATVNAFNLWYLSGDNWVKDDKAILLGYSIQHVAYFLCIAGLMAILLRYLWQRRDATSGLWEASALAYLVVFLFVTRAHERHVFPYFALLAVALAWRRAAFVPWALLTVTYCANLAFSWHYLVDEHRGAALCDPALGRLICGVNLAVLPLTLIACHPFGQNLVHRLVRGYRAAAPAGALAPWPLAERYGRIALAGIVVFAAATRFVRLNDPPKRYFDEVYHAYTAEQWAKGNTDAWLWNTKSPEKGCSYEWTHPPLAKLAMEASLRTFGIHPWAWRLPGAVLGTVDVLLIYALAMALFRHRGVALLAAAFAALDMLPLFASRIGMNDVYCVTFILLALLLVVRERTAWGAPVAVGVALACKWTALYALPLLAFVHLLQGARAKRWPVGRHVALWILYVVCVPAIYLASYVPFFRAGHDWSQLVELQKQMWYYHTGLKATHPYSSQAWQWPMLNKAVWAHTDKVAASPPPSPAGLTGATAALTRPAESPDDGPSNPPSPPTRVKPRRASPGPPAGTPAVTAASPAPAAGAAAWSANVYAWGNPIIWCAGLGALLFAACHLVTTKNMPVLITVAGYLAFWAPWLASPRIMFLYHYLPSLPFLYLALAWAVVRTQLSRRTIVVLLASAAVAFLVIFPYVTAIYVPHALTPVGWRR